MRNFPGAGQGCARCGLIGVCPVGQYIKKSGGFVNGGIIGRIKMVFILHDLREMEEAILNIFFPNKVPNVIYLGAKPYDVIYL